MGSDKPENLSPLSEPAKVPTSETSMISCALSSSEVSPTRTRWYNFCRVVELSKSRDPMIRLTHLVFSDPEHVDTEFMLNADVAENGYDISIWEAGFFESSTKAF